MLDLEQILLAIVLDSTKESPAEDREEIVCE